MKVHQLQNAINNFLDHQLNANAVDWYYPHSMINTFQDHWVPPNQESLLEVIDECLKSGVTQRWWKREKYRPKEMMLLLIEADPELATIAMKDLYNEDADLEGRLSRFQFYCDNLLKLHRQKNIRSVETHHYQDASMVSLYLAGRFPETYALYPGLDVFAAFCRAIGSPDIPVVDDLIRYNKVARVVYTFLVKNDRYKLLIDERSSPSHKIQAYPFQVAYEVISFEGKRFKEEGHAV